MRTRLSVGLLLALMIVTTDAGAQAYRWVDENGNVNYAGSRDQVPEPYRSQLPAVDQPESPAKPTSGRTPDVNPRANVRGPTECILVIQGTRRRPGGERSFPTCDECRKAIEALHDDEAVKAACIAGSH
jgi:hypothetical protein